MFQVDDFLTWDPAKYNGVEVISMNAERVWRPDIVILNVMDDESYKTNIDESKVMIIMSTTTVYSLQRIIN